MKKPTFFDYIYYRVNETYFGFEGKDGALGAIVVSIIQSASIGAVLLFFARYFFGYTQSSPGSKLIGYVAVLACSILYFYNYFKYHGKYDEYKEYWKSEAKAKRGLKGVLIILLIVVPIICILLINALIDQL